MATGIHPPEVCRLLLDPTLLPYFLYWSTPGGAVTPCSDLWSFFLPFPGPFAVLRFVSFAAEGPARHRGGVWACRMTRWQLSRATAHTVWDNKWRETSSSCRTKGTVQFLWWLWLQKYLSIHTARIWTSDGQQPEYLLVTSLIYQ